MGSNTSTTNASFQLMKNAHTIPNKNVVISLITFPAWIPIPAWIFSMLLQTKKRFNEQGQ